MANGAGRGMAGVFGMFRLPAWLEIAMKVTCILPSLAATVIADDCNH